MRTAPVSLVDMTEKEWDYQLFSSKDGLASTLGWTLRYHTLRSKGSASGFPDRVIVRDRIIAVELKTERGKPSDAQVVWLDGLANAGGEVYLWRPSDLDEVARVLSGRWTFLRGPGGGRLGREESCTYVDVWQPASIWIPGVGRADSLLGRQTREEIAA